MESPTSRKVREKTCLSEVEGWGTLIIFYK
jgi:hypothetical protein